MNSQIWVRLQLLFTQAKGIVIGTHKMQVLALDGEPLDNIDRIQPYGFSYKPKQGCQSYIIFPSGDRTHGFCLVQGDRRYTVELEEGEACVHDDQGQQVHLTRDGIVIKGAGKPITITDTPKTLIESDLEVTGNIKTAGNINADGEIKDNAASPTSRTMAQMRSSHQSHTHTGDDGGSTSTPNQSL